MRGAIPSLSQYFFMAWCLVKLRTTLPFYLYFCRIEETLETKIIKIPKALKYRYLISVGMLHKL
jgi:hypothetical protein